MNRPIRDFYDHNASTYDRDLFTTDDVVSARRCHRLLRDGIPCNDHRDPGSLTPRILEIGCGTGLYTQHLARRHPQLIAMDLSGAMLQRVRDKMSDSPVRFLQGDATALPFAAHSFEHVLAFSCLHHVPDTPAVFREVFRILQPGGRFLLMEPNPLNPVNCLLGVVRSVERGMLHAFPGRFRREARRAGFHVQDCWSGSFFPAWPAWLSGWYQKLEPVLEEMRGIRNLAIFHYYHFVSPQDAQTFRKSVRK
ncbi:MAG: class I SAM-dependent methyltransferase [Nitrospirae bacterium]|nr:class I SAM-dependent methyltransferase [Magnetococcales bacterium]HAT50171.1 hypothetical protein [Alphaproteobacteria bacterium]